MNITMIGSGYVGRVSGACFADFGHVVTCVDRDESKIARLLKGEIPIYEQGLDELVASNVRQNRLFFMTELEPAVPRVRSRPHQDAVEGARPSSSCATSTAPPKSASAALPM